MTESPTYGIIYNPFGDRAEEPDIAPLETGDTVAFDLLKTARQIQYKFTGQKIITPQRNFECITPDFTQKFDIQIIEAIKSKLVVIKESTIFELGDEIFSQAELAFGEDIDQSTNIFHLKQACIVFRSPQTLKSSEKMAFTKWFDGKKASNSTFDEPIDPVIEARGVLKNLSNVLQIT